VWSVRAPCCGWQQCSVCRVKQKESQRFGSLILLPEGMPICWAGGLRALECVHVCVHMCACLNKQFFVMFRLHSPWMGGCVHGRHPSRRYLALSTRCINLLCLHLPWTSNTLAYCLLNLGCSEWGTVHTCMVFPKQWLAGGGSGKCFPWRGRTEGGPGKCGIGGGHGLALLGGRRPLLTKTLEWNLRWCVCMHVLVVCCVGTLMGMRTMHRVGVAMHGRVGVWVCGCGCVIALQGLLCSWYRRGCRAAHEQLHSLRNVEIQPRIQDVGRKV